MRTKVLYEVDACKLAVVCLELRCVHMAVRSPGRAPAQLHMQKSTLETNRLSDISGPS